MFVELEEQGQMNSTQSTPGSGVRRAGILVADEMALVLTQLKFELEARGFNVWLAMDGDDALDLYQRHRDEIDLVLLAVQMPGLDGPHTLELLQMVDSDVVACFMAGSDETYPEEDLLERGAACVFLKPFSPAAIGDLVQRMAPTPSPLPPGRFLPLS